MSSDDVALARSAFLLDADVTFLNHGSFGACPRAVLKAQERLRERMERQPVQFFMRDHEPLLDTARAELAAFVGADPLDLVFVPNATSGVNAVLRSLDLRPGDELLTTDHAYGACRNALEHIAGRAGARVVVAPVPFPLASSDEIVAAVLAAVGPRTRLALLDHVTSPTAIVFPIATLVRALGERGVDVLVDGAHGPGMLPLDLRALGAAYYTGNCHKWLCAPKGAGFLHVRRDRHEGLHPVAISHGLTLPIRDRPRLWLEFDWTGTVDPTPYLCVPEAIRYVATLWTGGWPALMARNQALARGARARLASALGVTPPCPEDLLGAIATLPLPDGEPLLSPAAEDPLKRRLLERFSIEVPIFAWPTPQRRLLRISAQIYNDVGDYERLANALAALVG